MIKGLNSDLHWASVLIGSNNFPCGVNRGWLARVQASTGDLPTFQGLLFAFTTLAAKHRICLTRKAKQVGLTCLPIAVRGPEVKLQIQPAHDSTHQ